MTDVTEREMLRMVILAKVAVRTDEPNVVAADGQ